MNIRLILALFTFLTSLATAQSYRVDRYVIGSGGEHSQSANYGVNGTIGQPILGHSSSTNYAVDGGFWPGAVNGPSCDYIPGDANGSGSFTGLDVTYSVRYFKGGPHPPYSCECTPGNTWYVTGDVNGSCTFSGLDITYMVRYFKGGPSVIPCADCPPGGLLLIPGGSQSLEKISEGTGE